MPSLPPSDAGLDGRLRLIVSSYQRLTGKHLLGDDMLHPPGRGMAGMGVVLGNSSVSTPTRACVVGALAPYNHGLPLAGETTPARGTPKVGNPHPIFGWAELTPPVGAPPLCGDPSAVPLHGGGDVAATALREALWNAPRAIVAHGTEDDPVFFYGNRLALQFFEMSFDEFTRLPSRFSAELLAREERAKLLERVTRQGYADHYSGMRIASSGKRFMIADGTVWNLVDEQGKHQGQAAVFDGQK
jgi:hypothetical protein